MRYNGVGRQPLLSACMIDTQQGFTGRTVTGMSGCKKALCLLLCAALFAAAAAWAAPVASAEGAALQFDQNGKFTVMQITDIQTAAGVPTRVISAITEAIRQYQPDLAVFTGDNVIESILTEGNFKDAVDEYLAPLINSNTKFAVSFGNHDDQGPGSPDKTGQYAYYQSVGGSNFVDHDVPALDGVGSGSIDIYPYGQSSGTPAYRVYLMDSGSDPSSGSFDCCYTSQIDYYIQQSLQTPGVPSLWFQHVIVPDIYTRCMTTADNGTGVSKTGTGSFSGDKWYLDTARINWARCSSSAVEDIYRDAPSPATLGLYESAAHRSSAQYGSKTLYEAWRDYGGLKGAYFGHEHLNEFVMTTTDGIDLGYGESTGLYKTLGIYPYHDDNPGVSIYELDIGGSYTSRFVAESDLAHPAVDLSGPTGSWRIYAETVKNSLFSWDNGTEDDVYIRMYSENNATGTLLYQTPDLVGTENSGNSGNLILPDIPTTNRIKSLQIIMPAGTNAWGCARLRVFYTPYGGAEQQIWDYDPDKTTIDESHHTEANFTWFQANSHTLSFNSNGADGGEMPPLSLVWGVTLTLPEVALTKTGYFFTGWAESPSGPAVYNNGAVYHAGAADAVLYAQWAPNVYTVGYSGNGSDAGVTVSSLHVYDTPSALTVNAFTRTGYTFAGWSTKENGGVEYTDGQTVLNLTGENALLLYAVWTSNQPVLQPAEGSPAVIDSTGGLIYGLEPGLGRDDFLNGFVQVAGNGTLVISGASGSIGTGTKIELIDNASGTVVRTYFILIFGDVNGDGNIDSADAGEFIDYENFTLNWDPAADALLFRAGDINGDGNIDSADAGLAIDVENYLMAVDQTTGLAVPV